MFDFKRQPERVRNLNDEMTRQGEQFTRRIANALKKESWSWWSIEMAWTAGPATFIAIYGGYMISYGTTPKTELLYYFASYSVIAGLMAVIVRTVRKAADTKNLNTTQRLLLRTSNEVFRDMISSRDCFMKEMDETQRKITAATVVLKDADATEEALGLAVKDLTGSKQLARVIQRIEIFRHHGMNSRIADDLKDVKEMLNAATASLKEVSPQAAALLEARFSGFAPSMSEGQERYAGFLERTLNAIHRNNPQSMTSFDVYDIFYLAFELLNGREIAVLHPVFNARKEYVEAARKLDKARGLLKQAVSKRNSRLKSVVDLLSSQTELGIVTPVSFTSDELVTLCDEGFKALRSKLKQALRHDDRKEIRRLFAILKNALKQYEKVTRHQKRAKRFLLAFRSVRRTYNKLNTRYGYKIKLDLQGDTKHKNCISIKEDTIMLDDAQKITFAKKLKKLHKHMGTIKKAQVHYTMNDYKMLAMEYIMILDEIIHLGTSDELMAIEQSNAACFGHIDINAPARAKIGYATLSIEELQQSRKKVAHRLAKNLREYYNVPLSESVVDYFVKTYGANKNYLEELNTLEITRKSAPETKFQVGLKIKDWERLTAPAMFNARLKLYK